MPIKYHIEVCAKYWEVIFRAEGITDRRKQQARIVAERQQILDFPTGAEDSNKAWFSRKYYASVMNIQKFYTDSLGQEFCRAISNALLPSFGRFA